MIRLSVSSACLGALVLAGCSAVQPGTIVYQPTGSRAPAATPAQPSPGSIYVAGGYRPLFEDRRPRAVGDMLTIVISEKATVGKNATASSSKTSSLSSQPQNLFGMTGSSLSPLTLGAAGSSKSDAKEIGTAGSNFTTTLGVTVAEVLPNGNLLVTGEKQIGLDQGAEFIRFSGVVAPSTISSSNTVSSTQVADARLEYRTNSQIDKAQLSSMLNRFFYSVLPL